MKPLTREWVEKAEGDYRSAKRELTVRPPNCDLVCFLAQQCAEKYLKARLVEAGMAFSKTHDLEELLDAVAPLEPSLRKLRKQLASLTDRAVDVRYPGEWASEEVARESFATCQIVRHQLRGSLGVDEPPTGQMKFQIKERKARYRVRRRK